MPPENKKRNFAVPLMFHNDMIRLLVQKAFDASFRCLFKFLFHYFESADAAIAGHYFVHGKSVLLHDFRSILFGLFFGYRFGIYIHERHQLVVAAHHHRLDDVWQFVPLSSISSG